MFAWVLRNARARVRDRENLRFERTRVFGRARRVFLAFGREFVTAGALGDARDVFYLEVDEVLGFADGTATTTDLADLVAVRRAEFDALSCRTRSSRPLRDARRRSTRRRASSRPGCAAPVTGDELIGIGCCAGRRPRARTHRDRPADRHARARRDTRRRADRPRLGDDLPRGLQASSSSAAACSSHSAIVAREMGIPAVVSLAGLTRWLSTGDLVEFDGTHRRRAPAGAARRRRTMGSEAAERADFSAIRYAQCWEDADILLSALDVQPGETVVSIASAGDNTLSILTKDPAPSRRPRPERSAARVPRAAGGRLPDADPCRSCSSSSARAPADAGAELYAKLRPALGDEARRFWDAMPREIEAGVGSAGQVRALLRALPQVRDAARPLAQDDRSAAGGRHA